MMYEQLAYKILTRLQRENNCLINLLQVKGASDSALRLYDQRGPQGEFLYRISYAPLTNSINWAAFLHECGHLVHGHLLTNIISHREDGHIEYDVDRLCEAEREATDWALDHMKATDTHTSKAEAYLDNHATAYEHNLAIAQ